MAGYLTLTDIRRLKCVRAEMIRLVSHRSLSRAEIARDISRGTSQIAGLGCDKLYGLVCLAINIYEADFYQDPSTRHISLSRRAAEMERMHRRDAEDAENVTVGAPLAAPKRHYGTTAAGKIHDALQAAEG